MRDSREDIGERLQIHCHETSVGRTETSDFLGVHIRMLLAELLPPSIISSAVRLPHALTHGAPRTPCP